MKRLTIVTALAVMMFAAPSAWGSGTGPFAGQHLVQLCEGSKEGADDSGCVFYVSGVIEGMWIASTTRGITVGPLHICTPEASTEAQFVAVVRKWLKAHPEQWHLSAVALIAKALYDSFPCPESQ